MEQYIPKSVVVAEIERLITPENGYSMDKLLDFVDTLEVKEVNLDFEQELYKAFGQIKDFTLGIAIAKRFYDMGRKHKEPVSEELEEAAFDYAEACKYDGGEKLLCVEHFKVGAKWQKEKDFQYVKKECERTGSCCDNDIAIEAAKRHPYYYVSEMEAYANIGFKEGAMWQKEQFEKNRLKHCNSITNEQAELEQGFIDQHIDKYNRMPTFLDAIEYGMRLQKEQMMAEAIDSRVCIDAGDYPYIPQMELYDYDKDIPLAKEGDKYKVVLIKED